MATKNQVTSTVSTQVDNHGSLGKRLEFGSRSHITKNKAGAKYEFFTPTIELLFGIGNDHVGRLIIEESAWAALKKNKKVNIDTLKDFTKKFL